MSLTVIKPFFMLLEKEIMTLRSLFIGRMSVHHSFCLFWVFFSSLKAPFLKGISVQAITSFGENMVTQVHRRLEYEIVCTLKCKNHADC